jgi:hypothetical protein
MPVIEAQCASILVPHDHRHINHERVFSLTTLSLVCKDLLDARPRIRSLANRYLVVS